MHRYLLGNSAYVQRWHQNFFRCFDLSVVYDLDFHYTGPPCRSEWPNKCSDWLWLADATKYCDRTDTGQYFRKYNFVPASLDAPAAWLQRKWLRTAATAWWRKFDVNISDSLTGRNSTASSPSAFNGSSETLLCSVPRAIWKWWDATDFALSSSISHGLHWSLVTKECDLSSVQIPSSGWVTRYFLPNQIRYSQNPHIWMLSVKNYSFLKWTCPEVTKIPNGRWHEMVLIQVILIGAWICHADSMRRTDEIWGHLELEKWTDAHGIRVKCGLNSTNRKKLW